MKKNCFNHPGKEALSSCHSCGRHFCADCLTEGLEYYYCKNEKCQEAYEIELGQKKKSDEESEIKNLKRRRPTVALLLSFLTIGLGQTYNGQIKRGTVLYLMGLSFLILSTSAGLCNRPYGGLLVLVMGLAFALFVMFDAFRNAVVLKRIATKGYNRWYFYVLIVLINSLVILPLTKSVAVPLKAYRIPSGSMKPTLLIGDHFVIDKKHYKKEKLKRGDVVVFKWPRNEKKRFIQRIIGLPGNTIEIKDDALYVNHERIELKFVGTYSDRELGRAHKYLESLGETKHYILDVGKKSENFGPKFVPENAIFVMGDNRDQSLDSRYWGFVSLDKVEGKALYIYWSKHKRRIGLSVE